VANFNRANNSSMVRFLEPAGKQYSDGFGVDSRKKWEASVDGKLQIKSYV